MPFIKGFVFYWSNERRVLTVDIWEQPKYFLRGKKANGFTEIQFVKKHVAVFANLIYFGAHLLTVNIFGASERFPARQEERFERNYFCKKTCCLYQFNVLWGSSSDG